MQSSRRFLPGLLLALAVGVGWLLAGGYLPAGTARAASAGPPTSAALPGTPDDDGEAPSAGPVNPVELRAFINGVLAQQQQARPFGGCIVTVVRDGRLFLNQGHGMANLEARVPVHPERTLFRIGSISKVFVYLALQQQIAAGRLRLDSEVAPLVPDLPLGAGADGGDAPLTVRHLVTHTAGFDEQVVGLFSHDPAQVRPLAEQLARTMPPRVRPAGVDASYSNHGTALAARLVEVVSGQPYPDYLHEHLLLPLDLAQTTLAQPVPAQVDGEPAVGYRAIGGVLRPQPPEVVPLAPVGGMSSTGADMAKLMMALLQLDGRALPEATVLGLRERLHVVDPRLPAMLFGLYEHALVPRSLGHGGDTIDFHSDMRLFPDQRLGVFMACNDDGSAQGIAEFMRAFTAHYFPRRAPAATAAPSALQAAVSGWYAPLRVSETSMARIALLLQAMPVGFDDAGLLVLPTPAGARRFAHVEGELFRALDGDETLLFQRADDGAVTRLWIGSAPMLAFAPVGLLDHPLLNLLWLGSALLLLIVGLVLLPLRRWRARRAVGAAALAPVSGDVAAGEVAAGEVAAGEAAGEGASSRLARWAAGVLWACAACLVAGVLGLAIVIAAPDAVVFGELAGIRFLLALLLLGGMLLVLACALVWRSPVRPRGWWWLLGASIAVVLWLGHWNLLGFHYPEPPPAGAGTHAHGSLAGRTA